VRRESSACSSLIDWFLIFSSPFILSTLLFTSSIFVRRELEEETEEEEVVP
jgi:hypothetical protein